jgi:Tfp pilus assembly protein PilX
MMKKLRDDSGIAMVIALLVLMVVTSLSVVAFQLSQHDLDASAGDRRSVQAIHGAEAGLDRFLDYLGNEAPITAPACAMATETLPTSPPVTFTVTATYYSDTNGTTTMSCPITSAPAAVLIRSIGTSAAKSRTMEAFVGLGSTPGGQRLSSGAVFAYGSASWGGQATVLGNPDDGDLYSVGNLDLSGGGTVQGNVSTQGNLLLGPGSDVKKDAVAKGSVLNKGIVRGIARSSTSSIDNSAGTVYGNAYYSTGSPPTNVVAPSTAIHDTPNPTLPLARPCDIGNTCTSTGFPIYTYDAARWTTAGYLNAATTYTTCSAALNAINGIAASDHRSYVVRVSSGCSTLSLSGTVPIKGNLAIITDGDLKFSGNANFQPASGAPDPAHMFLMARVSTPLPCSGITALSMTGGTVIRAGIDAVIWTPCDVKVTGGAFAVNGQIFAHDVSFSSGSTIQYKTVEIPGTNPSGFQEQLRYRREVTNS